MVGMKSVLLFTGLVFAMLTVSGCAGKKVYEPKKIEGKVTKTLALKKGLHDVVREGAMLGKSTLISKKSGAIALTLPAGYNFINESEGLLIIADDNGDMEIVTKSGEKVFAKKFTQPVVSAALQKNLLALVLADNTIALYDIKADNEIYRESLEKVVAIDARTANPVFINDLIVFPTLDGRLLIMDSKTKTVLRDVALSDKPLFNNVIFLEVHGNILVAATATKVIVITPRNIYTYSEDIKDILYVGHDIYLFTKGGKVIHLNEKLQKVKESDFEYANFVAVAEMNGKLYAVEKNGYLIEMDRKLDNVKVKALSDKVEAPVLIAKDKLYIGDKEISLR
jgi:hypothetical protein